MLKLSLVIVSCLLSFSYPLCVLESSLSLSFVHLVSENHLAERTVAGCMVHCLSRPGVETVMVSYSPGVLGILGDQFNCLCGQQGALGDRLEEEAGQCSVKCPGGDLSCGDTEKDLVSVYRLHRKTELCQGELQGCLTTQAVHWESVLTLHDFEGLTVEDCHQRCDNMSRPGFSISRYFGTFLQCSCGTLQSVSETDVLDPSVCSIIDHLRSDLYYVTCKDDNDNDTTTTSSDGDVSQQYLGCVMRELFQHQEMVELEQELDLVSPAVCEGLCSSLPGDIRTVGVQLTEESARCYCSLQTSLPVPLTGPESDCTTPCSPDNSFTCGGPGALSVYRVSSHSGNALPLVDTQRRDTEILMIDHVRVGLDVMLMFVCLILLLMIIAFILHKHYQQSYTEIQ